MKIYDFPSIPISKQIFYVPGAAIDGGLTTGGVQMRSPEPGGFGVLEIHPSFQTREWRTPFASWLMSKTNGEYLRVRLAPTPQIASAKWRDVNRDDLLRLGPTDPKQEMFVRALSSALPGTTQVSVDCSMTGPILAVGHVIGHGDSATYLIDDVQYVGLTANLTVKPPFRSAVSIGAEMPLRPHFIGVIANGNEIRATYDAENAGAIQLPKIILNEVIL